MKRCTICGETKQYSEFHRQAGRGDGYCSWCKPCKSDNKKEEYARNRAPILARSAKYRKENPVKVSLAKKASRLKKIKQYTDRCREKYIRDKDKILEYQSKYRKSNWPKIRERNKAYVLDRLRNDPLFRLTYSVRSRTSAAFRKQGFSKDSRTFELIGCRWDELMEHMQRQFSEGMTIENYGKWHVDHKVPLSAASTEEELIALCHFTNLQPLWAADNIRKGAKIMEAV